MYLNYLLGVGQVLLKAVINLSEDIRVLGGKLNCVVFRWHISPTYRL